MNLYRISPQNSFLHIIADFIIFNFSDNIDRLKIVLPNGLACLNLQKILLEKKGISLLPEIVPFSNLMAEGADIFTIPSENLSTTTYLEEKTILAEVIFNYQKLQFNIIQALNFSPKLAALFYEFIINDISIESIGDLPTIDQAEHWQTTYQFLEYSYKYWQQKIAELKKIDKANYHHSNIESEIRNLQDNNKKLIIAGIFGHNQLSWNFIKHISNLQNGYVILPPISALDDKIIQEQIIPQENTLYCLQRLLTIIGKNLSDFQLLGNEAEKTNFDNLLTTKSEIYKSPENKIKYAEYDSIFDEAEAIANICKSYDEGKKIALIVSNEKTKEIYCNFLSKYSQNYNDLVGNSLSKTHEIDLVCCLSEFLCNDFDLKKLIILLKNPLIESEYVQKMESLLIGQNRFIKNWQELNNLVISNENQEFIEWYKKVQFLLNQDLSKNNIFHELLKSVIRISEELCINIWSSSSRSISEFFIELLALNWQVKLTNITYFPEILRSLSFGGRFFDNKNENTKITICSPEDAILLRFDLVILTNFSENIWPISQPKNPWFNQQMQNMLGLYSEATRWGMSLYNFYLLIHNPNVMLTRSKKQDGKSELLPSNYLQRLKFALKNDDFLSNKSSDNAYKNMNISAVNNYLIAVSDFFPEKISVTDVEMLVRNPYGFYAKKILKLRKQDDIITPPTLAEFGSFIHKVIDEYSKINNSEMQKASNRLADILDISANILLNLNLPLITKKIWQNKFTAIAEDFIVFDMERRSKVEKIYTEIKGEMSILVGDRKITITAVADRIEIDRMGKAIILDYKTGTLPSKNDVLQGLSPQLMLEALIIRAGGFNIAVKDVSKLLYVKIASSKPYIDVNEIAVSTDDLAQHFAGLQKLLTRYVTDKNFSSQVDLSKYNDYKYLTRNI